MRLIAIIELCAIASWSLCVTGIAWYCMNVAGQITYVTLADGRQQERSLPLIFRLLLPFAPNLHSFVMRPLFQKTRDQADKQLVSAGFEGLLSGREFVAIKIVLPIVCGTLWIVTLKLIATMLPGSFVAENQLFLAVLGVGFFYIHPVIWLRRSLKRRHRQIQRALPFVLDLLTLSVEAGMDFMSALQRNCQRRRLDPLNEELIRMTREIQVGIPRRKALKNMAERVNLPELRSVTHALIQADELGVGIGPILRIQSDQIRTRRFERAEKLANEAPVKMLGPLMLFIFPAVFIILLAPILRETLTHLL